MPRKNISGQIYGRLTALKVNEEQTKKNKRTYWDCQCSCGNIHTVRLDGLVSGRVKSCGKCVNDLTNKKFGRLTVLEKIGKDLSGHFIWKCQCECGNIKNFLATNLIEEKTLSCGCLQKEKISKIGRINEIGNRYGKLTVMEPIVEENKPFKWRCKCDCGNYKDILPYNLRSGKKISCGCLTMSRGEFKIKTILEENNIHFIFDEIYFKDLVFQNNSIGRFDFILLDENQKPFRIIEFDGKQHFIEVEFFKEDLKLRQERDDIKNKYALSHNIPLVRIPYWEENNLTLELIMSDKYLIKEV